MPEMPSMHSLFQVDRPPEVVRKASSLDTQEMDSFDLDISKGKRRTITSTPNYKEPKKEMSEAAFKKVSQRYPDAPQLLRVSRYVNSTEGNVHTTKRTTKLFVVPRQQSLTIGHT